MSDVAYEAKAVVDDFNYHTKRSRQDRIRINEVELRGGEFVVNRVTGPLTNEYGKVVDRKVVHERIVLGGYTGDRIWSVRRDRIIRGKRRKVRRTRK